MYGYTKTPIVDKKQKVDAVLILKFGKPAIYKLRVGGSEYKVEKTGLHYSVKKGAVLFHIFGVVSGKTYFSLELNTKTLNCYLLEQKVFD
jgi:hypothetical protein